MRRFPLSDRDKYWLERDHPDLTYIDGDPGSVVGTLAFDMALTRSGYVINPPLPVTGDHIVDAYTIEIDLTSGRFTDLPIVRVVDERILAASESHGVELEDVHVYGGMACLGIRFEENDALPDGYNLRDFINQLVIPFFYGQSYFESSGKWPWDEYGHRELGILEWYLRKSEKLTEDGVVRLHREIVLAPEWQMLLGVVRNIGTVRRSTRCLCRLPNRFGQCHPDALAGLRRLKRNLILARQE